MGNVIENCIMLVAISLGSSGVFLCATAIGAIGLIVNIFLAFFKIGYSKLKRIWYVFYLSVLTSFCGGIYLISSFNAGLFIILLGVYILFYLIVFYLPQKSAFTSKQLDLARFMDKKAKEQTEFEDQKEKPQVTTTIKPQVVKAEQEELKEDAISQNDSFGLDFVHVKNVLKRLDYYSLSPTDKRQVRELESLMFKAENGEKYAELKSELNDGLGALLKIMSKYGV